MQSYTHKDRRSRHLVKHEYHDHAFDEEPTTKTKKARKGPRGGVTVPFPVKLHNLLQDNKYEDIISWQPHGRCFIIHRPKDFLKSVMPKYFKQTKLTSFQRQLNLYSFQRLTSGPDKGGYYHELFLRGKVHLCSRMQRIRIKGTRTKGASNPDSEPNFYRMCAIDATVPVKEEQDSNEETETEDNLEEIPKFTYTSSPVCVSTPVTVSLSNSRSESPSPLDNDFSLPQLPISKAAAPKAIELPMSRRHSLLLGNIMEDHNTDALDLSTFPDFPYLQQDDSLTFEGKEFHYLESGFPLGDNNEAPTSNNTFSFNF